MKTIIPTIALILASATVGAQDVTTVNATSADISENLDLQAVAAVFGEAKDLDDFERKLNDPELQICNLDLNADGFVDYLRVVESSEGGTHLIVLQAVLGQDVFQDVATVDVERDNSGTTRVQVVGDVYMYGPNYVIEPYYVQPPVMYVYLWSPRYRPWNSPYYWGYYPNYYNPWEPYPVYVYHQHVHVHVHRHPGNTYGYVGHRRSQNAGSMYRKMQRNDYAAQHPNGSFSKRNEGVANKQALMEKKEPEGTGRPMKVNSATMQNAKPVIMNQKPTGEKPPVHIDNRKETAPATKELNTRPVQQQTKPNAAPQRTPQVAPERIAPSTKERKPSPRTEQREERKPSVAPAPRQERERPQPASIPNERQERQQPERHVNPEKMPNRSSSSLGSPRGQRKRERE